MTLLQPIDAAPLPRLSQVDPADLLARLAAEGRLADGHAHILDLDAIRHAFGRRWAERAQMVFEMVESHGRRLFGPEDLIERVGETDVLIVAPVKDPLVSRGLAARLLGETIAHFLGEARPSTLTVKLVAGFEDGAVVCRRLEPEEIAEARAAAEAAERAWNERLIVPAAGLLAQPIITFDGRRLQLDFNAPAVRDLHRDGVAGRHIAPRLIWAETGEALTPAERMDLLAADMERVDLVTLDRAVERLASDERPPSLLVTLSFLSASSQRARTRLMLHLGALREVVRASVIWVLTDLPDGVPTGRLTEVAALLRPFGRAVFAETRLTGVALKAARAAGIGGLMLELPAQLDETDAALWLLRAGKVAERSAPTLIAANLPSSDLFPMAAAAGFTHATLRS
jgi:hypothetical protein